MDRDEKALKDGSSSGNDVDHAAGGGEESGVTVTDPDKIKKAIPSKDDLGSGDHGVNPAAARASVNTWKFAMELMKGACQALDEEDDSSSGDRVDSAAGGKGGEGATAIERAQEALRAMKAAIEEGGRLKSELKVTKEKLASTEEDLRWGASREAKRAGRLAPAVDFSVSAVGVCRQYVV